MCRSDSGADTRDSEDSLPASLADESKKGRGWKMYGDRKETEKAETLIPLPLSACPVLLSL